ncbi:hypothetical protein GYH30_012032 [Glycine max]|nr:hypothetical protein GYH30_012032 [Glycine max]
MRHPRLHGSRPFYHRTPCACTHPSGAQAPHHAHRRGRHGRSGVQRRHRVDPTRGMSFVAFCVLDLVDFLLCFVFKAVDLWVEAEFRPCY